jgi:general secretion pathway protein G
MHRTAATPRRPAAAGFTLIEMIVVVVIIGILAALLLPAIQATLRSSREAKVVVELKQLEVAIGTFKTKYGVEPPSQIIISTSLAGWNANPNSKALIQKIWPQLNFAATNIADGSQSPADPYPDWWLNLPNGQLRLNSGECLLFFLGGVIPNGPPAAAANWAAPIGFSTNPAYPFSPFGTSRNLPNVEFDIARIKDSDGNSLPEYFDALPGQRNPILYFSSYDGSGYRVSGPTSELPAGGTLLDVYRQHSSILAPGVATHALPAHKAQSFQLISPGIDGEYGSGGIFNPSLSDAGLTNAAAKPDKAAFDNLTNFHSTRLNP